MGIFAPNRSKKEGGAIVGTEAFEHTKCKAQQYKELVLEFHSTFRVKDGNFDQWNAVSFSLGRKFHEMTVAQLGVLSQFYNQEEVETLEFNTSSEVHSRIRMSVVW